jgi:uncharacterized protein
VKFKKNLFSVFIPFVNNWWILYNTLNGAMALIDSEAKDLLEKNDFSNIPSDVLEYLKSQEFIVPFDMDEIKNYYYRLNYSIYRSDILSLVLLTTYDCNFSCIYCYERVNNLVAPVYMDNETAKNTAEYIKRKAQELRSREISVSLYGGEPLLNVTAGVTVLNEVKKFSDENNIELSLGIVTNGSLLTKEVANKVQKYNVRSIQITIDGTKEIHDRRRPFKDGKGTFNIIMKNLLDIIDLFPPNTIAIRTNIDIMNYDNFPSFLDYLEEAGLKHRIILSLGVPRGVFPYCTRMQFDEKEIASRIFKLWKIAIKRGFEYHFEPGPIICSALQAHSFIIDPTGEIYKCWALVGKKEYSVGSIYEDKFKPTYYKFVARMTPLPIQCHGCSILPYCNGGCLYEAYYKTKNPFNIVCGEIFSRQSLEILCKLYVIDRYKELL